MSAHVLLNLLNKLGKEIKCEACRFYLFRNDFSKFNNTRARMLDSIYCDINITLKSFSDVKKVIICHYLRNVVMDDITFPENLSTTEWLTILLHGVISLLDVTSYDKWCSQLVFSFNFRCSGKLPIRVEV